MDTRFTIIIPSWNNLPFLRLCVESIRKNSAVQHQIVVHVNEGTDGTLEWVRSQGLDYTFSENNIGVCMACNMMRTKVQTDYIFYLNDDMYLLPGWDTALAAEIALLPDNRFFLSSTMIQPHNHLDGGITANYGDSLESFDEQRLLSHYMDHPKEDWRGATCPPNLMHRDIWDLIGGYSIEYTPGMGSDPDLTAKLWMVGVRHFKGLGASRAYHFETRTTGRVKRNNGRIQYMLKWGVNNSAVRRKLVCQGETWGVPSAGEGITSADRRLTRLKALWALITGCQLGPIDPIQ